MCLITETNHIAETDYQNDYGCLTKRSHRAYVSKIGIVEIC